MFQKLLILLSFFPTAIHGIAQDHILTGKITSAEVPLEAVTVLVAGTRLGATTGPDGIYRIKGIKAGNCDVTASLVGYRPQRLHISLLSATTTVDIILEKGNSQLDQVVVTGVSRATLIRENPLAMEAVSTKDIEQTSAPNVIDAIAVHAPGFAAVKTGPNVSKPFINGLGYNRVLTLYDGLRVETQQWGDEHGVPMDDYAIERAEVIKGPASLMYGSDAIAGVLSLFPAVPHGRDGVLHLRYLSEYQTNNGLIGNSLILSRGAEHWSWALRGAERIARNYTDPVDGRVYNTGFSMGNASAYVGYHSASGDTRLNASWYDNRQGIPDGSRDSLTRQFTYQVYESPGENTLQSETDNIKNRPVVSRHMLNSYGLSPISQHVQDYRLYTDNTYKVGSGDIKASLGFEENKRREFDHPTDPSLPGEYIILKTLDYGLRYNAPSIVHIEPSIGINGMYQTNSNDRTATDFPIPGYRLFDAGSYVYGKWKQGRWMIAGGIRYDHRTERGDNMYSNANPATGFFRQVGPNDTAGALHPFTPFSLRFQGISGSIGATWQVDDHVSVKANIARGYRSPNITEIASNGLDPGAHIYYLGNLAFSPEFSLQGDAGLSGDWEDWSFSANVFSNNIRHYIYEDQAVDAAGNPRVIIPGNKTFQFQQTDAQLYGGDAEIRVHPKNWKGFHLDNAFTCVYGYNRNARYRKTGDQGEYLPFMPPPRLLSAAGYDHSIRSNIAQSLAVKIEMDHNWSQTRYLGLFNTETATPRYTVFNASAHTDLRYSKKQTMQLQLQVNNIFNTAYQSHLSRLQYFEYYKTSPTGYLGIFDMGRNICVKAIFQVL